MNLLRQYSQQRVVPVPASRENKRVSLLYGSVVHPDPGGFLYIGRQTPDQHWASVVDAGSVLIRRLSRSMRNASILSRSLARAFVSNHTTVLTTATASDLVRYLVEEAGGVPIKQPTQAWPTL